MKIYLIKRRKLYIYIISLIVLILLLISLFKFCYNNSTPTMQINPIYQGNIDKPWVAFAVNVDWGEDVLPEMLKEMDKYQLKSTFFISGKFAEKYPAIVKEISLAGHDIGNHGFSHPHPDNLSIEKNMEEIKKTDEILFKITQKKINLFAPPYGERGPNCLKAADMLGYRTILWTADTIDWQEPPPSLNIIVQRVTGKKLVNGAILLMHPKKHTVQALPVIIETIQAKGFEIKKVSEII